MANRTLLDGLVLLKSECVRKVRVVMQMGDRPFLDH